MSNEQCETNELIQESSLHTKGKFSSPNGHDQKKNAICWKRGEKLALRQAT